MSRARCLPALSALVVLAGGVLAGCGVTDSVLRPGAAARVGETTISVDDVDSAARGACDYLRDNPNPQAGPVRSLADLRQQVAAQLVQRAAVEQILEESDTTLDETYESAVSDLEISLSELPAEQRSALAVTEGARLLTSNGLREVAEKQLREETGETPLQADIDARGVQVLTDWFVGNDVDVNPMYRLDIDDDGLLVAADAAESDLSVAVSGPAVLAVPPAADDAEGQTRYSQYVASLPDDQVCG